MKSKKIIVIAVLLMAIILTFINFISKRHFSSAATTDLIGAYKLFKKDDASKEFYLLLDRYKSDIIACYAGDEKKLNEIIQVFLQSLNTCDETLPTALAEIFSYRLDLFPIVMQSIPDKQKSEFLQTMQIGVANIEFEATKRGVPKAGAERVRKFKAKFEEYQKAYPYTK